MRAMRFCTLSFFMNANRSPSCLHHSSLPQRAIAYPMPDFQHTPSIHVVDGIAETQYLGEGFVFLTVETFCE